MYKLGHLLILLQIEILQLTGACAQFHGELVDRAVENVSGCLALAFACQADHFKLFMSERR
ncbi:hypothetical protein D3C86_1882280 [compost metagenome]